MTYRTIVTYLSTQSRWRVNQVPLSYSSQAGRDQQQKQLVTMVTLITATN